MSDTKCNSAVINTITLFWLKNPTLIDFESVVSHAFDLLFPVNLVQNVLTTGLIALKIVLQHNQSSKLAYTDPLG